MLGIPQVSNLFSWYYITSLLYWITALRFLAWSHKPSAMSLSLSHTSGGGGAELAAYIGLHGQ